MRVLQVAPWVTFGGADRGTIDWLRTLSGRQHQTYLLTTQESDNALFGEAERWAEEAWCLSELMPGSEMPGFILRFVASRRIDAVHVMNSKLGFDLLPELRARLPHVATVAQFHAEEGEGGGYPPYVATRFDTEVDAYSLVSQGLAARVAGYGVAQAKLRVIHLGVDAAVFDPEAVRPAFGPAPSGGLQILFPHRLSEQKDPLLMVEIAAALRQAGCDAVIHVVGDGEERPAVEDAVRRSGLEGRVLLHGAQVEVAGWYQATDVTLITSTFEGVPLVAYEAMAMARPVVTADVGAVGELVDGSSGFLVRPRASVPDYVAALRRLAGDADLRRSMGRHGRQRVMGEFTVEAMAAGHERLYADLARPVTASDGGSGGLTGGPPLLSLVLSSSVSAPLVPQTEPRYEVVDPYRGRGRWVLLWWGADASPLADPAFVEKAFQVARHTPAPVFVGLCAGPGHRWRTVAPPEGGPMVGAMVEHRLLGLHRLGRPSRWCSFPVDPEGAAPELPRSTIGRRPLARVRAKMSRPVSAAIAGTEEGFQWTPPGTAPLWLAFRGHVATLAVMEAPPTGCDGTRLVGRVFTRPFWGTVPLVSDGPGLVVGGQGEPVGHALSTGLPGMVELHRAVAAGLADARVSPPNPLLHGAAGPAWIDMPELPPASTDWWPGDAAGFC